MRAGDNIGASRGGAVRLKRCPPGRETRAIRGHLRSASSVSEMMTLQGNPHRSAAKGIGRGHREGVSGNCDATAGVPEHIQMVTEYTAFEQHLFTERARC